MGPKPHSDGAAQSSGSSWSDSEAATPSSHVRPPRYASRTAAASPSGSPQRAELPDTVAAASNGTSSAETRPAMLFSATPPFTPPARSAQEVYQDNWSRIVLGTTSGIMLLLVVAISYSLYVLICPYSISITSGILLSIVLHPRSRLKAALLQDTPAQRMRAVQQRWAAHGRFAGVLGSWLSLWHFAMHTMNEIVFFLGLNKVELWNFLARMWSPATTEEKDGPTTPASSCGEGQEQVALCTLNAQSFKAEYRQKRGKMAPPAISRAPQRPSFSTAGDDQTLVERGAGWDDDDDDENDDDDGIWSIGTPPVGRRGENGTPTSSVKRLISTKKGRGLLRLVALAICLLNAHLLLGLRLFVLMHAVLFAAFALTVPILPERRFLYQMGRVWRYALLIFFLVGVTYNVAFDVLSISGAVRRTTSAVVHGGGGMGEGGCTPCRVDANAHGRATDMDELGAAGDGDRPPMHQEACCRAEVAEARVEGPPMEVSDGHFTVTDFVSVVPDLFSQHRDEIQSFVLAKVQETLLRELSDLFNQTNITEMAAELIELFSLQSSDGVGSNESWASSSSGEWFRLGGIPVWSPIKILTFLFSGNVTQALLYSSVGDAALIVNDGAAVHYDVEGSPVKDSSSASSFSSFTFWSSTPATARNTSSHIDWFGVSKVLSMRLLPYVEYSVRLLARLGSNLMDLFDSLYGIMLFVFFFRYLTHLEHTVLYYIMAKLLRVVQPQSGERHARNIERDMTTSFVTLLESFWHLTWFHFSLTFCVFKCLDFPTPCLSGAVAVVLALFPLVPKCCSLCSLALVWTIINAISETSVLGALLNPKVLSLIVVAIIENSDEWLLRVSRHQNTRVTGEHDQLQPVVVGTSVVLGFVAYGTRGIVLGPLTVIIAKVFFDNWDSVLAANSAKVEEDLSMGKSRSFTQLPTTEGAVISEVIKTPRKRVKK